MKKSITILITILVLAGIIRFYKLGEIPNGLYQDETAIAYNAYSIRQTGKDEHGRLFPLYFESFGDQKLPVYIYSVVVSQELFGMNAFSVRFPSAFFGIISILCLYFFILQITKNNNLALLSAFFLTITPWHIHYSRATFEVSLVLCFFLAGATLLLMSLEKKRLGLFTIGTLFFVIAMYSYNLTRILSPLLFLSYIWLGRKKLQTVSSTERALSLVVVGFLLLPFLLTLFTAGGSQSAAGTLINSSSQVQAPLIEFRSYLVGIPFLNKLINYYTLTGWQYLKNITSYLSVPFFFISGSLHGNHGIGTHGQFHLFELPLMIVGLFVLLIKRKNWSTPLLVPSVLTILIASFTREAPHATRSFSLLMTLPFLSALGFSELTLLIKKLPLMQRRMVILIGIAIGSFFILTFFSSYMFRFPVYYASQWRASDKDVGMFLLEQQNNYERIIIDKDSGLIYTSILYYTNFLPNNFLDTVKREAPNKEGFSSVLSFGSYEYKRINWEEDMNIPNSLILTSFSKKPDALPAFQTFYYPIRPVVIANEGELLQYPFTEPSYVAIQTERTKK